MIEKETARIEAFSDGVFAIAITLLVLDLRVPEKTNVVNSKEILINWLTDAWPSYLAFTLSFFCIFIMWVNHHKIFKQIYRRNSPLMFANGLVLFLTTCVSYPTALLSRYYNTDSQTWVVAIYTGMFVLINLSYNLLWYIAGKNTDLLRPGLSDHGITRIRRNYVIGLPIHIFAFILSFLLPPFSLLICASLWIYWAFTSGKLDMSLH